MDVEVSVARRRHVSTPSSPLPVAVDPKPENWFSLRLTTLRLGCLAIFFALLIASAVYFVFDTDHHTTNQDLHAAVAANSIEDAQYHLSRDANVHAHNEHGLAPLHVATAHGHQQMVEFLVKEGGAGVNGVDAGHGLTALQIAAGKGNLDMVKFFVGETNADVNRVTGNGLTPLHAACVRGHHDVVEYLVKHARNLHIDAMDKDGMSSLHAASLNGHLPVVRILLELGKANVNVASSKDGVTPLHLAAARGHSDIVHYLVKSALADASLRNKRGLKPSDVARAKHHIALARFLDEHE